MFAENSNLPYMGAFAPFMASMPLGSAYGDHARSLCALLLFPLPTPLSLPSPSPLSHVRVSWVSLGKYISRVNDTFLYKITAGEDNGLLVRASELSKFELVPN